MKALAAQVNSLTIRSAARESAPAPQAGPSWIPGRESYKEVAAKIPRTSPTILNAQNKAKIVIKAKKDCNLDKTKIIELIRQSARDDTIKADFSISNNAGPNLFVTPDTPGNTDKIREALNTCLKQQDCMISGPLTPRLIVFNVDKQTSSDDLIEAVNKCSGRAKALLHKVHDNHKEGTYHAFIDVDGASLKDIFPTGEPKAKLRCNMTILNMEIAKTVRICFNCGRFGHLATRCQAEKPCCTHCAGDHQIKDCPHKKLKDKKSCLNCKNAKHAATDMTCPAYKKQYIDLISKFF
jgi:hypothetical protein